MQKDDNGYFHTAIDLAAGDYEYKFQVESNSPWQLGKRVAVGGSQVVVVANFSDNALSDYKVPDFPDGDWHEYIFNYAITAHHGELTDGFGPSECKIYVKK